MIDLKELGIGQEELQERVVKMLCDRVLESKQTDEEGEEYEIASEFSKKVEKAIMEKIDEAVSQIAEKHISPNIVDRIEKVTLNKTNEWGEAQGEPVTFIEYIVQRAGAYMTEEVDYDGKTRKQSGGYSFHGAQARIAHMIDKHLHYSIQEAVKGMLAEANSQLSKGLAETCETKLKEILAGFKVNVELGR